jgi:hypothetical protein
MAKENCSKSDLILQVKSKRISRFKAGSELSGKVNLVSVDFNEEIDETSESVELKLRLTSEACAEESSCED